MQKQQHTRPMFQAAVAPLRETQPLEHQLGQLQAQLRAMPLPGSVEYRFSLSTTRRFAQEVVVDLVQWLHDTETLTAGKGRHS